MPGSGCPNCGSSDWSRVGYIDSDDDDDEEDDD
jgi:hypothetical protein